MWGFGGEGERARGGGGRRVVILKGGDVCSDGDVCDDVYDWEV